MRTNYDLSTLLTYFEEDISPMELAKVIEGVIYWYTRTALTATKLDQSIMWIEELDTHLCYLNELKEGLQKVREVRG